jgi:SSS family transporter
LPSSLLALAASLPTRLRPFDLGLIVVYLLGITAFGLRFRQKKGSSKADKSLKSYFLANNTIPWWAISLSIVSAETSTLTIISIPGVAFAGDFGFLQVVMGYMIGRVVVAALFLPRYFEGRMLTAYQLIDQRFGPTLHKVTAGLFLLTRAAAEGVRVFAISIVVGIAIGTNDTLSIAIISLLTLLYTFEGGMAAVIWTDVVQMAIYIGGTLIAIVTLGTHVPDGWSHIHSIASAADKFHMLNFAFNLTQSYTFWAGVLGGTFLTMASHGTDQLMVQRMLAARNLGESRLALLSSGVVIFFQFTLFLLIGAGLFVFYGLHPQAFSSADRIFPSFIVQQMPLGIAGLLIAAILAAAMSNLSAALNSLSSTTVVDFYMHWRPQAADRERMLISRSSTVLWAFVLFAIAVYSVHAGGKGHVVETGLSIASVAYGCLLGVFLLGTLTRYATQTGTIIGMITGFALNLALWQLPGSHFDLTTDLLFGQQHSIGLYIPRVAFTWFVLIGALATFAVGSLASLIFRKQSTHKAAVTTAAVILCIFGLSFPSQAEEPASPMATAAKTAQHSAYEFTPVSTLLNEAIAAHKLPGAVVLIGHNDKVVFEKAYGLRKLAGEPGLDGQPSAAEPMTEDTIFDMASLTKCLVTATAIMQLYEQGKLQFDDPVAKYLPDFAANGKDKVTIRQLLTHYSGLPEDVSLKDPWGLAAPDKAEGIRRALASPLITSPGTHFEYSDINYIALGALVEKLSGRTLDDYATYQIFQPLGMTHTRYLPLFDCRHQDADDMQHRNRLCDQDFTNWNNWIEGIAPTAHDNEGTPATNPNFDHLLRGTVDDPTTRRMGGVAGHAGVFSTAHDISLYAQALLDKLLYDKGPFPLQQSTLKLMTTPEQPATAEHTATIFTTDGQLTKGVATRGFGWDINTAFSRPRGSIFPIATAEHPGSFGHTGFTGTSLWMDPTSNTYVILLANAIHPRGNPPISHLRGEVATAAAKALGLDLAPPSGRSISVPLDLVPDTAPATLTGLDTLEATHFAALAAAAGRHHNQLRIGLLTNHTGLDAMHRRTVDILYTDAPKAVPGLHLVTLFSPEHGLSGTNDSTDIANATDPTTGLPIISLYGLKDSDRRPRSDDLNNLDAIVIDLQDAGVRFYTYDTLIGYFLEAASHTHTSDGRPLEVIVLDRPNLIGGERVEGPVSDPGLESYTDYMPLPVRTGLTPGELARYINGERRIATSLSANMLIPLSASLTVVPMEYWRRSMYFDQTGLPWTPPSPNLRSLAAAILYPGVALLETTNVSVGRGTDTPFEHIGACWPPLKSPSKKSPPRTVCPPEDQLDGEKLAAYLTSRHIPGVTFTPTTFTVAEDMNHYPDHGLTIHGIAFSVTDRDALNSPELGIELLAALHRFYPNRFELDKAQTLVASINTMQSLANNEDPRTIAAAWTADLDQFKQRREQYLLYH